jgi:hypothetical protein
LTRTAAWRAAQGQFASSAQTCRLTPRFCAAGAGRLKHASVVVRSTRRHGQRLKLTECTSPRGLTCHCTDVQVIPLIFTLLCCTSAELLFSFNTSAPGRAAGGPRRGFMPQVQAALNLLKHASAPPQSYGQRLEIAEGASPRGLTCHLNRGDSIQTRSASWVQTLDYYIMYFRDQISDVWGNQACF